MDKNHRHRLRRPLRLERSSIYSGTITNCGYAYDPNGNMTANGAFTYAWDPGNRLAAVWKDGALVQSNRYDAFWRRREKVEYAPDGTAATNRYIYKDWLVLAITDGSGNILETYTHGADLSGEVGGSAAGIGGILASTQSGRAVIYHGDYNGNVVHVDGGNQTLQATYTYSVFGEVVHKAGTFSPHHRFSSKECDRSTGLEYYGCRFYSSQLQRWLTRDPRNEVGKNVIDAELTDKNESSINGEYSSLYLALGNCPVNYVDAIGETAVAGVAAFCTADVCVIEPTDMALPVKCVLYAAAFGAAWLIDKFLDDEDCPPCPPSPPDPPPRYDRVPPSRPHYPCPGNHMHIYKYEINQEKWPSCKCHYNKREHVICM